MAALVVLSGGLPVGAGESWASVAEKIAEMVAVRKCSTLMIELVLAGCFLAPIPANSAKLRVVYSFSDGSNPHGRLIDLDRALYGTTSSGGSAGYGTVFSVTRRGSETLLHSFGIGSDGTYPGAGLLIIGSKLYGTTYAGGTQNLGIVFSITKDGVEKILHSFKGGRDGNIAAVTEFKYGFQCDSIDSKDFDVEWIGAHFVADITLNPLLSMIGGSPGGLFGTETISPGETVYCPLFGGVELGSSTTRATGLIPYDLSASTLTMNISAAHNPLNSTTFTLLKNGNATPLSVSVRNFDYVTDSTHTVAFAAGDTCLVQIKTNSGNDGTVTWANWSLLLQALV